MDIGVYTGVIIARVVNTSGVYTAATDTLVLTGTNYSTLLESGEDASTDIKDRLDWSRLSWDIHDKAYFFQPLDISCTVNQ